MHQNINIGRSFAAADCTVHRAVSKSASSVYSRTFAAADCTVRRAVSKSASSVYKLEYGAIRVKNF